MKSGRTAEERLAGRYWNLLDYYPRAYREERGAELVGTLLDCARPGQVRPSRREARALVLEGLRMRAGTAGFRSRRATLAGGVHWGVLILLVAMTVDGVTALGTSRGYDDVREVTAGWVALVALAVLAGVIPVVLLVRGRARAAVPFVVAAGVADAVAYPWLLHTGWAGPAYPPGEDFPGLLPVYLHPGPAVVALLATVALIWLRPPPIGRRVATVAVLLPVFVWAPDWLREIGLLPIDYGDYWSPVLMLLMPLGYLGIIAYAVVDARPAVAVTVLFSVLAVELVASMLKLGVGGNGVGVSLVVYTLALALPVAAAAWLGARRQARLRTPDAAT